jgi:hypothetical protein
VRRGRAWSLLEKTDEEIEAASEKTDEEDPSGNA